MLSNQSRVQRASLSGPRVERARQSSRCIQMIAAPSPRSRKVPMLASIALASIELASTLATGSMNGITLTPAAIKIAEAVATTNTAGIINFNNTLGRGKALDQPYFTNDPTGHAPQNGRLWQSKNVFIGPGPSPSHLSANCEEPGPTAFGLSANDRTTILVQVGTVKVGISPWQRLEGRANRRYEDARLNWLYERGYTTGVRTFVNDAYAQPPAAAATRDLQPLDDAYTLNTQPAANQPVRFEDIQPRATIRIPADAPRFRKRMHVQSHCQPVVYIACNGERQVQTITGRGNSYEPTRVITSQPVVAAPAPAPTTVATAQ